MTSLEIINVLTPVIPGLLIVIAILVFLIFLLRRSNKRIKNLPKIPTPFSREKSIRSKIIGVIVIMFFCLLEIGSLFMGDALNVNPEGSYSFVAQFAVWILGLGSFVVVVATILSFFPVVRRAIFSRPILLALFIVLLAILVLWIPLAIWGSHFK